MPRRTQPPGERPPQEPPRDSIPLKTVDTIVKGDERDGKDEAASVEKIFVIVEDGIRK